MKLVNKRLTALMGGLLIGLLLAIEPALAEYELNMPRGVTPISKEVYSLHMLILWICVAIGVVVFGAIIYSVIKFRRSKGAVAAQFHHSTTVEIVWTVIPMLILIAMAIPATKVLVDMEDTSNADVTIKVTGYQWKWGYEYLNEGLSFYSTLDSQSNLARQANPTVDLREVDNYLLEVDEPVVVPVGKKIRFLLTSNDVIHAWWVPALGWKKDAIPGFINEAWTLIEEPGVYRGQCAELCGRDHAFMPIVVIAKSEAEYAQWVEEKKASGAAATPVKGAEAGAPVIPQAPPAATTGAADQTQAAPQQQAAAPQQQASSGQAAEPSKDALMKKGEQVYAQQCASCHQASGSGVPPTFPALAGSKIAQGPAADHIAIVLKGKNMMPPFAHVSDEDLAAVITYERNAWGNSAGDVVQPADVKAAR